MGTECVESLNGSSGGGEQINVGVGALAQPPKASNQAKSQKVSLQVCCTVECMLQMTVAFLESVVNSLLLDTGGYHYSERHICSGLYTGHMIRLSLSLASLSMPLLFRSLTIIFP